jgi:hypothetical protein
MWTNSIPFYQQDKSLVSSNKAMRNEHRLKRGIDHKHQQIDPVLPILPFLSQSAIFTKKYKSDFENRLINIYYNIFNDKPKQDHLVTRSATIFLRNTEHDGTLTKPNSEKSVIRRDTKKEELESKQYKSNQLFISLPVISFDKQQEAIDYSKQVSSKRKVRESRSHNGTAQVKNKLRNKQREPVVKKPHQTTTTQKSTKSVVKIVLTERKNFKYKHRSVDFETQSIRTLGKPDNSMDQSEEINYSVPKIIITEKLNATEELIPEELLQTKDKSKNITVTKKANLKSQNYT